ncbi:MAG: hypothetical protein ACRYFX_08745 [Janthinobacterium lividum]
MKYALLVSLLLVGSCHSPNPPLAIRAAVEAYMRQHSALFLVPRHGPGQRLLRLRPLF